MVIQIGKRLNDIYASSHKNFDYALDFVLSSIDVDCCKSALDAVEEFELIGEKTSANINEKTIEKINKTLGYSDDKTVERLLWMAVMFPEI